MYRNKRILAVVPARSGSKGVPHKNISKLGQHSLIGWAGLCLAKLPWIDECMISTDSLQYSAEAKKYGLRCPELRPGHISGDKATAIEVLIHAINIAEIDSGNTYDLVLLVEPTSPFRLPSDIQNALDLLLRNNADSVVTVSPLSSKSHPKKALEISDNKIYYNESVGKGITARQQLEPLYARNGICYALTRDCILAKKAIITEHTVPLIVDRPLANIDDPIDFEWAKFLMDRGLFGLTQ